NPTFIMQKILASHKGDPGVSLVFDVHKQSKDIKASPSEIRGLENDLEKIRKKFNEGAAAKLLREHPIRFIQDAIWSGDANLIEFMYKNKLIPSGLEHFAIHSAFVLGKDKILTFMLDKYKGEKINAIYLPFVSDLNVIDTAMHFGA